MSQNIFDRRRMQRPLTIKEALGRVSQRLAWYGPQTLRVGRIIAVGEALLLTEITTKSGQVVRQMEVDRSTGEMRLVDGFSRTGLVVNPLEITLGSSTRQLSLQQLNSGEVVTRPMASWQISTAECNP